MTCQEMSVLTVPEGGFIHRLAAKLELDAHRFFELLLTSPIDGPLDPEGKDKVRVLPPMTVTGEYGASPADVLVVGKMPNQHEVNTCRLHVGELGQEWQTYLRDKGVDVRDWRLTNVVPFKVPEYLAGKGETKQVYVKEGLPILAEVLRRVQPKVVVLFGAEALKGFSKLFQETAKTKVKFTDSRGTILEFPGGIKAVCCHSPSSVLKAPELVPEFRGDLDLVASLVSTGERANTRPPPEYVVVDNLNALESELSQLAGRYTDFALDAEWGANVTLRTIQIAYAPNKALVVHLTKPGLAPTELGSNLPATMAILGKHLGKDGVRLIGHNMRGDLKVLRKYGLDLMPQFMKGGFDTMLAYHIIPGNETLDKQLELVAVKMLKVDRYDKPLRDWLIANKLTEETIGTVGYGTVPDDILMPYGAMDAIVTFELVEPLLKLLAQHDVLKFYNTIIHPVNLPVLEMEENGIRIDQVRLLDVTRLFEDKVKDMRLALQEEVNWQEREELRTVTLRNKPAQKLIKLSGFNPDSVDHLREVLFGRFKPKGRVAPEGALILNLEPIKATDDTSWSDVKAKKKENIYNPSTDAESLGILSAQHKLAKRVQQYKFVNQIPKNFLQPVNQKADGSLEFTGGLGAAIDPDGRLRTSFRLTLETGRYATSPNLQNLPKRQERELQAVFKGADGKLHPRYKTIRSCFIASPGHVLVEADWNQAELWTMGYLAKDDDFIHTLQTSDVHTTMLRQMFKSLNYKGKLIGEYEVAELNKLRKEDKWLDSLRVSAKTTVFGVPYGRGGGAISREVEREGITCTAEEAKGWIQTFNTTFVKVYEYLQACKNAVIDPGFIRNPFGRYRAFPPCDDEKILAGMQREAGNFNIQSTVGDAMSVALCNLYAYRKICGLHYRIVLSIHDAVLLEVPCHEVKQVCEEVLPLCMTDGLTVPGTELKFTLGDPDVSTRWGEHNAPEELLEMGVAREYCGFKQAA